MKKQALALLLVLCMAVSMLPTTALAVESDPVQFTFDLKDGPIYIKKGTEEGTIKVMYGPGADTDPDLVDNIKPNSIIKVIGTTATRSITIYDGITVNLVLDNVSIKTPAPDKFDIINTTPLTIMEGGTVNLTLIGDNHLYNTRNEANGLSIGAGATLNITDKSTGTLTAVGQNGIGGGKYSPKGGTVNIEGGTVNAYGTKYNGIDMTGLFNFSMTGGILNACGVDNGIEINDVKDTNNKDMMTAGYDISLTGGKLKLWGGCTFDKDTYEPTLSSEYSVASGAQPIKTAGAQASAVRSFHLGGTMEIDAVSYEGGFEFDEYYTNYPDEPTDIAPLNILIDGDAKLTASPTNPNSSYKGIGLGSSIGSYGHGRSIVITDNAVVTLGKEKVTEYDRIDFTGAGTLGGGDNSQSSITLSGNALLRCAGNIGSTTDGADGGTIEILDNAAIGFINPHVDYKTLVGGAGHMGGADNGSSATLPIVGGSGGDITINTTGYVKVSSIGGGDANLSYNKSETIGGNGGNITIHNGYICTNHIGGGSAFGDDDASAVKGGDGGNITIYGGTFRGYNDYNSTMTGIVDQDVACAGIGGGGVSIPDDPSIPVTGGSGGVINIYGGDFLGGMNLCSPYNAADPNNTHGAAYIGGGNRGSGGIINIHGGNIEFYSIMTAGTSNIGAEAKYLPAFIGGGSAGGAGEITLSGGYVKASVSSKNHPEYGSDASTLGAGKGATDATGWVKVTGGSLRAAANNEEARPATWPTAADGKSPVYPVALSIAQADGLPSEYDGNFFYNGITLTSLKLTDKDGKEYAYGINGMSVENSIFTINLPVPGGAGSLTSSRSHGYDLELKVKKDNTTYSFTGKVDFSKYEVVAKPGYPYYHDDVYVNTSFTYGGEVVETLQITSDWGSGVKQYNGADQKPKFTVKNSSDAVLTEGKDYTLKLECDLNGDYIKEWVTVTEMKNSGDYRVTATGTPGTAYEGMTAKIGFDQYTFFINPKTITATYVNKPTLTKEYDGDIAVFSAQDPKTPITELALAIDPADLHTGDAITGVKVESIRYSEVGVKKDILIQTNSPAYTYTQNGKPSSAYNYNVEAEELFGHITVKVLGETNLDASKVKVTKVYDGTTGYIKNSLTGFVALKDLVGNEVASVTITEVSSYSSKDVGNNHKVTLSIGNLEGANSGNYQLGGGAKSIEIANAVITPADFNWNITEQQQNQEFTSGGDISQIIYPNVAVGVNNEQVSGDVGLWHDEACTSQKVTQESLAALAVGKHNIYGKFTPKASETNYLTKSMTAKIALTVVAGQPQSLVWGKPLGNLLTAYGTPIVGKTATNESENGGKITYSSSNLKVATVDAATGAITVIGAGEAVIAATAAAVEGKYRETSIPYTLTVSKKNVTLTADDASRKFGLDNPALTFTLPKDALVGSDKAEALGVKLTTKAGKTSPVIAEGYEITGTSESTNYNVTIEPGVLMVTKADKPALDKVAKNLLFSKVNDDVPVIISGLPTDCGTATFTPGIPTDENKILKDVKATADGISLSTKVGEVGQTATIPVTVTMQNYADTIIEVLVKLVDKTDVTITGLAVAGKTYDGKNLAHTGTPANAQGYTGTYEYIWNTADKKAPKSAGSYTLTVKIPENDEKFMGELVFTNIVIAPAKLTAKPTNISIYNGNPLPTAFTLEFVGLVAGDIVKVTGVPAFALQKKDGTPLENSGANGDYVIKWTNTKDIALENSNYLISTADGTLTISSQQSGGGDIGTPTPPPAKDNEIVTNGDSSTAIIKPDSTTNGNTTTSNVKGDAVKDAIAAAEKAAVENKTQPSLEIKVDTPSNTTKLEVTLPKSSVNDFANSKSDSLTINSNLGDVTISKDAAKSIADQAGGSDVKITVDKVDKDKALNEKQKTAVGDAPVYDISIISGGKQITGFDGGLITVSLPYTLKPGEDPAGIVVWYVDEQGNVQKVSAMYDVKTKTVIFTTNHLSIYAIGYDGALAKAKLFTDIKVDAWYYDAVLWAIGKDITNGTSATTFSPDADCTRAQVVTLLWNAYGKPKAQGTGNPFTDIQSGTYYYDAVLWAVEKGITTGTSAATFSPDQVVTRSQFVTLLWNAAGKPKSSISNPFSDVLDTNAYFYDAVLWAVDKGITKGTTDTTFSPLKTCSRGQILQFLYNFFK